MERIYILLSEADLFAAVAQYAAVKRNLPKGRASNGVATFYFKENVPISGPIEQVRVEFDYRQDDNPPD